jgi:chitin disaccharide deacetylase
MKSNVARMIGVILGLSVGAGIAGAHPQGHDHEATVQEKLGFSPDAKLLVIHADDLGMSHSKNMATFEAMKQGVVTSASVMMPTPWMREAIDTAKAHPELDIGVHLTLTAEWNDYKWGPLLGADTVPSLVTADGLFHATVPAFAGAADVAEVEAEVRAQIDLALELGLDVTHLDGHMGSLLATPEIAVMYMRIGQEYRLPIRLHKHFGDGIEGDEAMRSLFLNYPANFDTNNNAVPEHFPDGMIDYYNRVLRELDAGLNLLVLHLGFDAMEDRQIMEGFDAWGAKWRQIDTDWAMSEETQKLIESNNIILINNRIIRDKLIRGEN